MYRNIMVPVDGSPFSREAVLHGLRLASKSGAILRLVRTGKHIDFRQRIRGIAPDCREHLVAYKVPAAYRWVDELPRSEVGKVLRRQLSESLEVEA